MDDYHLVKEIVRGNDLAFSALIKKYQKLVYATAYKLVRNIHDAEDICQEVFLSAYKNINLIKNKDDLSGWFFRTACNKSLSLLRKKRPGFYATGISKEKENTDFPNEAEPVERKTPDLELEQKELNEEIFKAINALPEMQRKVLLMHKFENLSHQEISEMLDLTKASVESLIYRAKSNLRKSLFVYFKNNYKQGL